MATVYITFPYQEKTIRELRIGDIVYITGIIHTMRDMGYRRALDYLEQGKPLPVGLREGAIWHCGPIVRKTAEGWQMPSAGSTTSSRFTELAALLIRELKIRITLGKGTMGDAAAKTIAETGSCYLATTGGCAAIYSEKIRQVLATNWTDLGYPEAIWSLDVVEFGPLTVGIDSQGDILYEKIKESIRPGLVKAYATCGLSQQQTYTFLPRRVPGQVPFTHCK